MEILHIKTVVKARSHKLGHGEPGTVTVFTYMAFLDVPACSELERDCVVPFCQCPWCTDKLGPRFHLIWATWKSKRRKLLELKALCLSELVIFKPTNIWGLWGRLASGSREIVAKTDKYEVGCHFTRMVNPQWGGHEYNQSPSRPCYFKSGAITGQNWGPSSRVLLFVSSTRRARV